MGYYYLNISQKKIGNKDKCKNQISDSSKKVSPFYNCQRYVFKGFNQRDLPKRKIWYNQY